VERIERRRRLGTTSLFSRAEVLAAAKLFNTINSTKKNYFPYAYKTEVQLQRKVSKLLGNFRQNLI
jgi:hypothetical protein